MGGGIGLAIITLLVLLFTLFGLKLDNVSLKLHNASEEFESDEFASQVIESSGLNKNTSIFFVDKNRVMATLEHAFPSVEVINVETTFPNGLVIHIAEREELFAIASTTNYFIVDKDMKVLDIITQTEFVNTPQNAILLEGVTVDAPNIEKGDFLSLTQNQQLIISLAKSFLLNNRTAVEQKALFSKIEIKTDELREYLTNDDKTYIQITLQDGFVVLIYSPNTYLTEKVRLMFSALPEVYPLYQQSHYMEIFERLDNSLFCKLSVKN